MPAEIAVLAASGASSLVNLLATDSWKKAKELVLNFFSRSRNATPDGIGAELEQSHNDIAGAADPQPVISEYVTYWQTRLRQAATAMDDGETQLSQLVQQLGEHSLSSASGPNQGVQQIGNAQSGGKIYQQIHGVQNNW